jgi:hypothetical protein
MKHLFLALLLTGLNTMNAENRLIEISIKETPPTFFIIHSHNLKSPAEIPAVISKYAPLLLKEIKKSKLTLTGNQYHIYHNMGDHSKQSVIEVAFPIENPKEKYTGKFEIKKYEKTHWLSALAYGTQPEMFWGKVIKTANERGYKLTGTDQEMLVNIKKGANDITEMRLGIEPHN